MANEICGCRQVCKDDPGELQDPIAKAIRELREKGVP
jgi:hypothetical protein